MNSGNGLRFLHAEALKRLRLVAIVLTLAVALTSAGSAWAQAGDSGSAESYTIQRGDSWTSIAEENGISVEALKAANPQAIRANDWLNIGEEISIPGGDYESPGNGETGAVEATVHIVGGGESWNSIANLYDVPVSQLLAANPHAVRAGEVLHRGDQLVIPTEDPTEDLTEVETSDDVGIDESDLPADEEEDEVEKEADVSEETPAAGEETEESASETATPEPTAVSEDAADPEEGAAEEIAVDDAAVEDEMAEETATEEAAAEQTPESYTVQPGESWNSIARKLDVDPASLLAANAGTVRPGEVLYTGDVLVVPTAEGAEATESGEAEPLPVDEGADVVEAPSCPDQFSEYPEVLTNVLNSTIGGPEGLATWLAECGALSEEEIVAQDWTGDGINDLLVVYANPIVDGSVQTTDLMIFNAIDGGEFSPRYAAMYRARAGGDVSTLTTEDINADGQADIVWIDTTCGASTCFNTINVRSWDGSGWIDWTDGTITMAYANVDLDDTSEDGQGAEIVASGGVYGSVGAGPQRSRTETWASIDGGSYTLIDQTFSPSECLYHTVMDGNRALLNADEEGFGAAEAFFTDAIGNPNLIKCWVRDNELEELRTFSYFRLAQIAAYQDLPEVAGDVVGMLKELYPESLYADLTQVWFDAYSAGDVNSACSAAVDYAERTPETWQMLADYGYTNPTFSATGICPLVDTGDPEDSAEEGSAEEVIEEAGESDSEGDPADDASTDVADASTDGGPVVEGSEAVQDDAPAPTEMIEDEIIDEEVIDPVAMEDLSLPECPPNVDRFARLLPDVLMSNGGDINAALAWLESCEATGGAENVIVTIDLNEDGVDDIVVFPTIVSDLGFGPGGSQGSLLVYHGQEDGSLELAYEPEVYGQPTFLAAEDINDDGRVELAWIVESCASFCVIEVQMVSWNGNEYEPAIEPGATIAMGTARFEPVGRSTVGAGQELVLEGGVSGQSDGGLATPHLETWQSVEGSPYERIDWVYDREAEGNDCLGLRLIEGDMALHAAGTIGYGQAIDLYSQALDPSLLACSLYGIPGDDELILLQGLASFRLMQAQALDGDSIAARATLLALQSGQPEADYTSAATQWLEAYTATGDAAGSCALVGPIFTENEDLWKITDHFGYNHPALPAQQICYVPE